MRETLRVLVLVKSRIANVLWQLPVDPFDFFVDTVRVATLQRNSVPGVVDGDEMQPGRVREVDEVGVTVDGRGNQRVPVRVQDQGR